MYVFYINALALLPLVDTVPEEPQNLLSLIVGTVVSSVVVASLITGLIQFLINRRNSRIIERKNSLDAESDLVARYKEAAAEERAQKASAVQTVKDLLSIAEDQVTSLKSTVLALTTTIDNLHKMATIQVGIIEALTIERDRSASALEKAQGQIEKQKMELLRHQHEILELTYPKAEVVKPRGSAPKSK